MPTFSPRTRRGCHSIVRASLRSTAIIALLACQLASASESATPTPLDLPSTANPSTPGTLVDWDTLQRLVLERSPILLAQRQQITGAQAAVVSARALPNPEFEYIPGRQQARVGDAHAGSLSSLGASWRIENPWMRQTRIQAARLGSDAADMEYAIAVNETLAEARRRLVELALRREEVKLATETLEGLEQIRKRIEVRVRSGEVARFELVKAETEVLNARQRLSNARLRVQQAAVSLEILTGGALPDQIIPDATLTDIPAPDLAKLGEEIAQRNPELLKLQTQSERATVLVRMQRQSVVPDMQVRVTRRQQPDIHSTEAGLVVAVPLLDRRDGPIAEAQAEATRQRVLLEGKRQELAQLANAAIQSYRVAEERVKTLETGVVEEARNAVRIAETAYRFGERALLEVLDAQRVLRAARAELLEARFDLQQAAIELERLRGSFLNKAEPAAGRRSALTE